MPPARWAIRTAALAAAILLVAFVLSTRARAHGAAEWIMEEGFADPATGDSCCGPEDCAPLEAADVKIVPGGYLIVPTGETIPESRALYSKDGRYWRCRVLYGLEAGKTRCFFRGLPGS